MSMTIFAALAVFGLVAYAARRFIIGSVRQSGRDAERAERAEADLRVAQKQGEVMLEQRSAEDAANRLSRGDF